MVFGFEQLDCNGGQERRRVDPSCFSLVAVLVAAVIFSGCGELELGSYDDQNSPARGDGGGTVQGNELNQSCADLGGGCGVESADCCATASVEAAEFVLGSPDAYYGWARARVAAFYPDRFEVTVERFARFVAAFEDWTRSGNPAPGAGEHPEIPGTGWRAEWALPRSRAELESGIVANESCHMPAYSMRQSNPTVPMNCVSWQEAFAFCIWDGKRLLTEAEWERVAKSGAEDLRYPWGNTPEPNPEYAVYSCAADGSAGCSPPTIWPVGSKPLGRSRHNLDDLAGSVQEWVFDAEGTYVDPCYNCANTSNREQRMFRGGSWKDTAPSLEAEHRNTSVESPRIDILGFRCARSDL